MRTRQQWLQEYATTHRNPVNKLIHLICVPAILFSILGLLWHLRLDLTPWWLNGGVFGAATALVFYARLGAGPFLYMLSSLAVVLAAIFAIEALQLPGLWIYSVVFVISWIAQFYGHHVEGKKPSFFEDIQFLLIGPLWLFYRGNDRV